MKKLLKVKGVEFSNLAKQIVPEGYQILDLPLNYRVESIKNTNKDVESLDSDFEKVFFTDKIFLLNQVLENVSIDYLKHLNVIVGAKLKTSVNFESNIVSDALIIRHNRIFLIQFSYKLVCANQLDMAKPKIKYVLRQIDQELKLKLPQDTQIDTFVFDIGDVLHNANEIKRLSNRITKFYEKTTNRELLKIIE